MIVIATIDELLDKVDSKYTLVHLAARRAREINSYYHSLGEGLGAYTPPLVESSSNKPLSIALEEIAEEKIVVQQADEARRVAEELLGGIEADDGAEIVELDPAEVGEADAAEVGEADVAEADVAEPDDAGDTEAPEAADTEVREAEAAEPDDASAAEADGDEA
ncbi:MAG: DNA-directed RNA polymerase subunit omega [Egibacteraceae bacterium]